MHVTETRISDTCRTVCPTLDFVCIMIKILHTEPTVR